MSTHGGGSRAGRAGQAQALVHTKDEFAEASAGKRGTIGEHMTSSINTASLYSDKQQSPVTLLATKSNSEDDENEWHKDNNSDCDYQVHDDKNSFVCSAEENIAGEDYQLADGLTQEDKRPQGKAAYAEATIESYRYKYSRKAKDHAQLARGPQGSSPST